MFKLTDFLIVTQQSVGAVTPPHFDEVPCLSNSSSFSLFSDLMILTVALKRR